jgi:2-keto-4-pentenoate hydratase/2-oxohepta-3-ene-1,7-dioic acid hydratase in catechol pathway
LRLVRFESDGVVRWGVLEGQSVRPVRQFRYDAPVEPDDTALPVGSVRLLAPVDPPRNVFCMGLNYLAHVEESPTRQVPKEPVWFTKATTSIVGPEEDVVVDPALTSQLDWEVELAVVLRRGGRRIPASRALDHVLGYTVLNDLSARDVQFARGGQWFYGKSLDGLCPVGPVLVTSEEIPDPQDLELWLRVNGQVRQHGFTRDMIFSVAQAIEDLSRGITLLAGDVIATGTPAGMGFGQNPPVFLRHGDVVEAEISRIGVLRNRIVFGDAAEPDPGPSSRPRLFRDGLLR